jgi:hypothetical protein
MSNFLKTFLFGAFFIAFGIGFLFIFGENTSLICTRTSASINCTIQRNWLGIINGQPQTLRQLQGATIDESCDDNCTYRVVIQTAAGPVPLTSYYSSGFEDKNEISNKINTFVKSPGQANLLVETNIGLFVLLPIAFGLVGIIIWVAGLSSTIRSYLSNLTRHESSSATIEGKLD